MEEQSINEPMPVASEDIQKLADILTEIGNCAERSRTLASMLMDQTDSSEGVACSLAEQDLADKIGWLTDMAQSVVRKYGGKGLEMRGTDAIDWFIPGLLGNDENGHPKRRITQPI